MENKSFIRWFNEISIHDIPLVGGKNASLGEMVQALSSEGINIPNGFTVTSEAFIELLKFNNLENKIYPMLKSINANDVKALSDVGLKVRSLVRSAVIPDSIKKEIIKNYHELSRIAGVENLDVAVRSSATAEDLPGASFAGQQETFLNVRGDEDLLTACRNCFASLYTDRAISYRIANGFDHEKVQLSIGIQQMIRSDLASSGVIFTLDPETGARNVILINSSYGLGENIVGGRVDPDEFLIQKSLLGKTCVPILRRKIGSKLLRMIYSGHGSKVTKNINVSKADQQKVSLSDSDIMTLAEWALKIENHYSNNPMDIEWAKDGNTGKLYILQARPETIHSNKDKLSTSAFSLKKKSKVLLTGRAVGTKIGAGPVRIIHDVSELPNFQDGDVLVADMTDPDWEPVMKKASAIVTNRGGRTCHAAIISREHGVPCIVGSEFATDTLIDGKEITVSCAEGDEGIVYEGRLPFSEEKVEWKTLQKTNTKIMVNLANPAQALMTSRLPVDGVGLVRMEFIISDSIRIHPMALVHLDKIEDGRVQNQIKEILGNYNDQPEQFFIDKLAEGISVIAGAFYPRPVIVRFSDFKTNEYSSLIGGAQFETFEENPMIGFRGASRYYDDHYREGFALECRAIKKVRDEIGLTNVKVMIPFCRSPEEGKKVIEEMKKNDLVQGKSGLEVYVMSEIPTNVLRAHEFAKIFDGFSIGSNDLTQMVLGVDRDSSKISRLFNERDPSVLAMLKLAINGARSAGKPIGICGQAPSDFPEISELLVKEGITSISVTTDAVFKTIRIVSEVEHHSDVHSFIL